MTVQRTLATALTVRSKNPAPTEHFMYQIIETNNCRIIIETTSNSLIGTPMESLTDLFHGTLAVGPGQSCGSMENSPWTTQSSFPLPLCPLPDPVSSPMSSLFSDFGALSISQRRKVRAPLPWALVRLSTKGNSWILWHL